MNKCIMIGKLENHCNYDMANRVYWWGGLCPTIPTRYDANMTGFNIMVEEEEEDEKRSETCGWGRSNEKQ